MPTFSLFDGLDGPPYVNEFHCSCGERLYPDCDVSRASIADEWERHLIQTHEMPHDYERLPSTDKRSLCRHCLRRYDDAIHVWGGRERT